MDKLILLAVIVLMVYCLLSICLKSNDYSVTHMKKVLIPKRKVKIWALLGGIVCAIVLIYSSHAENLTSGTGIITLNYSEASKAQNSNKTRFSMSEILSDEVLDRAIEKGGFTGVTREALKKSLSVTPAVQGYSYDKDNYHISTEFRLSYRATKETRKLVPATVLQLTAESFKELFIQKYAKNFTLLTFKKEETRQFKNMDYYDIAFYLSMRADNISRYMSELNTESPSFKSDEGLNFSSLSAKSGNIRKELLDNDLLAYIRDNGISKNKDELLKRLSFNNIMMGFDMQKANSSFDINNEAVNMYAAEMTRIALVPTVDEGKDYYMSRTKVGLDDLSLNAKSASDEAANLLIKIRKNSTFAEALRGSHSGYGTNAITDAEIDKITQSLLSISEDAKKTAQEYTETRMNGVISTQINTPSVVTTVIKSLIIAFMFFVALYVLSITKDYMNDRLSI